MMNTDPIRRLQEFKIVADVWCSTTDGIVMTTYVERKNGTKGGRQINLLSNRVFIIIQD